ncbi:MAG: hypothetical protein RL549_1076 [Verrucomicrobiota bacterium]
MSSGKKDGWGSSLGIILAVTGSAVGLGNFLRFPGLAAKYDGGAFLIPYFLALLFLGLPIAWSEWAMGRYGGQRGFNSCPGIFRTIWKSRLSPYFGVLGLIVPVVIYMYYLWIESWCLGYALKYLTGGLNLGPEKAAYADHFTSYVGLGNDGAFFQQGIGLPVLCLLVCIALNFFIIYRGLSGGIEKVCLWGMPLLVICAVIVLCRVLTLGTPDPAHPDRNVIAGLGYMWATCGISAAACPDFYAHFPTPRCGWPPPGRSSSASPSASVSSLTMPATSRNGTTSPSVPPLRWPALTTIPAAFLFLGAAGAVGGTFGLGFQTLPLVFDRMPLGQLFGFLWFFLLFIAAITSSLSMLQPAIAFFEEGLGLDRRGSVSLLGFITLMGTAIVVWFTKDLAALDAMDFWVGSFCIFVLATIQTLLYGWVLGPKRGREELERGGLLPIPRIFDFVIRYISPVFLLTVFALWLHQSWAANWQAIQSQPAVRIALLFVIAVAALFLLLIARAVRTWKAREGKSP